MTDKEVMQMALDALLTWEAVHPHTTANAVRTPAIEAIRVALEQPDPEPVAWRWLYAGKPEGEQCFSMPSPDADIVSRAAALEFPRTVQHLYTAPPKREWQGLTDEEIAEAMVFNKRLMAAHIEAKLREKNT